MPATRKADFYLGCLGGSVFIDFDKLSDGLVVLRRISFDGYGCCNIGDAAKSLDSEQSARFLEEYSKNSINQYEMTEIIQQVIELNKGHIWKDALEEYGFLNVETT